MGNLLSFKDTYFFETADFLKQVIIFPEKEQTIRNSCAIMRVILFSERIDPLKQRLFSKGMILLSRDCSRREQLPEQRTLADRTEDSHRLFLQVIRSRKNE